jgi:choline dehydrogenase
MDDLTSDYIVVGAGAAGCVVAGRLAEDPSTRVTVLEAGGGDGSLYLKIPALSFMVMSKDEYNWNFDTEPVPGLDGRKLNILSGKVVGGGSSVNGLIYSRGFSREYDYWRQMGCEGWSFEDVLPYFKRSEGSERGGGRFHGGGGPMKVKKGKSKLPIYKFFLKAVADSGFPIVDDLVADMEGFGYYDTNVTPDGRRMSAATAFLAKGKANGNLALMTDATALRVLFEQGKAVGIEILHQDQRKTLRARREVILSAGAIKTPQLLMLSGIGPARQLVDHGIAPLVDAPNVGANYQNHVPYTLQYLCSESVSSYGYMKPLNALKAGLTYLTMRTGPLAETAFGVGGTFKSDDSLEVPDIQVVVSSAIVFGAGTANADLKREKSLRDHLPTAEGFAVMVYQGSPYSRGTVGLRSSDPLDPPLIRPNHLSDPRDMETLKKAVKRMRETMKQPAVGRVISREISPGDAVNDDAALEAEIRKNGGTVSHHCGTCAMGSSDSSVVDPQLRVRGVGGLTVADNSIIPVILNATLHSHALMIGERAVDFVKGRA